MNFVTQNFELADKHQEYIFLILKFTSKEWKESNLKIAQTLFQLLEVFSTNENITLYCRSGRRSEQARKILTKLGYSNVTNGGSMAKVAERYSQRETDNNNH